MLLERMENEGSYSIESPSLHTNWQKSSSVPSGQSCTTTREVDMKTGGKLNTAHFAIFRFPPVFMSTAVTTLVSRGSMSSGLSVTRPGTFSFS